MTTWCPLILYAAASGGFTLGFIAAAVFGMAADQRKGNSDEHE